MPDWADITASELLDKYAVMKGDKIAVLAGQFEAALATQLRFVRAAATVEIVEKAEASVRRSFGQVAP